MDGDPARDDAESLSTTIASRTRWKSRRLWKQLDETAASNGLNSFGSQLTAKRSDRCVIKGLPYGVVRRRARFSIGSDPSCATHVALGYRSRMNRLSGP